jgi:hypothetical protein
MTKSVTNKERPGTPRKLSGLPIVLAVLVIGAAVAYKALKRPPAQMDELNPVATSSGVSSAKQPAKPFATPTREVRKELRERSEPVTQAPVETGAVNGGSPEAALVMARLSQFDLSRGVLTRERAQELNQSFKQLAEQGAGAVPSIRQFLARNQDLSFKDVNGGNLADYSSLRQGLFDVLKQIGGPEAVALSRETLQVTADPMEIAMLARNLEALDPGQHREEALNAAREALAQAATGQLGDVGPLFAVLQTYGDSSVLADLDRPLPQWDYYATMALAGLPDGIGVPTLIRQMQDPEHSGSANNNFRFQVLAQLAGQYPEAGAALLDQARLNQISDSGWRKVAIGLASDQYQLTNPLLNINYPPVATPGLKSYHIHNGNQNFFSTPILESGSGEQIAQRVALINQLLAATSNPTAIQSLQGALATLSAPKPAK